MLTHIFFTFTWFFFICSPLLYWCQHFYVLFAIANDKYQGCTWTCPQQFHLVPSGLLMSWTTWGNLSKTSWNIHLVSQERYHISCSELSHFFVVSTKYLKLHLFVLCSCHMVAICQWDKNITLVNWGSSLFFTCIYL